MIRPVGFTSSSQAILRLPVTDLRLWEKQICAPHASAHVIMPLCLSMMFLKDLRISLGHAFAKVFQNRHICHT